MEELQFAVDVAREAGRILMWYYERPQDKHARMKGVRDPVTKADVASENHIVSRIRERFPDHAILAEEEDRGARDGERLWIVDPLDATVNFLHGHPFFAVSIAHFVRGEPRIGVVYAPHLRELFVAAAGQGCHLNGRRLQVSATRELSDALLATGFSYRRNEVAENNVDHFADLVLAVRGLRRCGCAALDLAYVAAGRYDAFWELWLSPYDVAAGALLVQEAGGTVTDFVGGSGWLHGERIIASNGRLHETLRQRLHR